MAPFTLGMSRKAPRPTPRTLLVPPPPLSPPCSRALRSAAGGQQQRLARRSDKPEAGRGTSTVLRGSVTSGGGTQATSDTYSEQARLQHMFGFSNP